MLNIVLETGEGARSVNAPVGCRRDLALESVQYQTYGCLVGKG